MNRIRISLRPFRYCFTFSFFSHEKDAGIQDKEFSFGELYKDRMNMTGWERIQSIFYVDEFYNRSQEINYVYQSSTFALIVGIVYGGITQSRISFVNFMQNNQASAYDNTFDARRQLQDKVTMGFAKGAWKWGWRMSAFTFCFTSIHTLMATYRGETSALDYSLAGFCSGFLYKLNLGIAASVVGGLLGLVLGTAAGVVTVSLLNISGTSMDDVKFWQYKFSQSRKRYYDQAIDNASEGKSQDAEKTHDDLVDMYNKMEAMKMKKENEAIDVTKKEERA